MFLGDRVGGTVDAVVDSVVTAVVGNGVVLGVVAKMSLAVRKPVCRVSHQVLHKPDLCSHRRWLEA